MSEKFRFRSENIVDEKIFKNFLKIDGSRFSARNLSNTKILPLIFKTLSASEIHFLGSGITASIRFRMTQSNVIVFKLQILAVHFQNIDIHF